jgi:hypothetical protein
MWINKPMMWILRSPLHGLLSKSTVLVTLTGRKSGKKYSLPVNYVRAGDVLWVTSQRDRTWWRNLLGGAPLEVVLAGQTLPAEGEALLEGDAVTDGLRLYLAKAPRSARYFGVRLDPNGEPLQADLAKAAGERVMIEIRLNV